MNRITASKFFTKEEIKFIYSDVVIPKDVIKSLKGAPKHIKSLFDPAAIQSFDG